MVGTLVEISCQKRWTTELSLSRAWSLRAGCCSLSIARRPLAELTIAAAMIDLDYGEMNRERRAERRVNDFSALKKKEKQDKGKGNY